jgi:crossover junction endodeoxyribonuclease RuvC
MKILGIDPGIGRLGWGVITSEGSRIQAQSYGCIETEKSLAVENRLLQIYESLTTLIQKVKPEALAVEELFFNTNVSTAMAVGQARGVVLLLGAQHRVPVGIYTPLQVKVVVTGFGKAEKAQVGQMVKVILKLPAVPKPDDTADALAVAITHAFSYKAQRLK